MFGSTHIGRWLGIDVFIHGTFWLLPGMILFSRVLSGDTAGLTLDLAVLFGIFGCVALHEFGHAIAAMWYGIRTRDITLYPIGGVARLENIPRKSWPEIVVALAGPAVNVAIATVLFVLLQANFYPLPSVAALPPLGEFLERLLMANIVLVVFNLIPAFPMDGGRVLRAVFQLFMNRVLATEAAAGVSTVIAALMFGYGVIESQLMLCVLAAVVFLLGRAELMGVRMEAEAKRRRTPWYEEEWDDVEPRREPREPVRVVVAKPIDGWEWDDRRQLWVEYRDGFPVRTALPR